MSLDLAIDWFTRLLAFSLVIQSIEWISLSKYFSDSDVFVWSIQRRDLRHTSKIFQIFFQYLFADHIYFLHLFMRLCAALSLVIAPHPMTAIFLFLGTIILLIRWRGAFNGGSDFMSLVTVTGLVIGTAGSVFIDREAAWAAAFWYVTIHSMSSYFMSGAVKLLNPYWRKGRALIHFLDGGLYGPLSEQSVFKHSLIAVVASWGFILWEISFPWTLFDITIAYIYCGIACLFHLLVFRFFGLNRFVWAWVTTFPALLYCAGRL